MNESQMMMIADTTTPGYFFGANGERSWMPIPRIYSPPIMHEHIVRATLWLPEDAPSHLMGLFIGAGGIHFKNITTLSGAAYLFLLKAENGRYFVDIWGYAGTDQQAAALLARHWHQHVQPLIL